MVVGDIVVVVVGPRVVIVVEPARAARWSRKPAPNAVGVPLEDVMSAGPEEQSHTSHVHPR